MNDSSSQRFVIGPKLETFSGHAGGKTNPDGVNAHLRLEKRCVPAGCEWAPSVVGWLLVQAKSGTAYWMSASGNFAVTEGAVAVISPIARGKVRASVLAPASLRYFSVHPARLAGLFSVTELRLLDSIAAKEEFAARVFARETPVGQRMKSVDETGSGSCSERLRLSEIFIEAFADEMAGGASSSQQTPGARERLETFLREMSSAELLNMNLLELARLAGCTPRHLNRVFKELVGMSLRQKHTELKLMRACELLANSKAKVVDVALESGYQSLSLFNSMFARRFGMSPGQWRQNRKHSGRGSPDPLRGANARRRLELFARPPRSKLAAAEAEVRLPASQARVLQG